MVARFDVDVAVKVPTVAEYAVRLVMYAVSAVSVDVMLAATVLMYSAVTPESVEVPVTVMFANVDEPCVVEPLRVMLPKPSMRRRCTPPVVNAIWLLVGRKIPVSVSLLKVNDGTVTVPSPAKNPPVTVVDAKVGAPVF